MPVAHKELRDHATGADGIRVCQLNDISSVAELFTQSFLNCASWEAEDLETYLRQVYFENPWVDDSITSLVYEQKGVIEGFLGVIPRPMKHRGKSIRVAVTSALMVRADSSGRRNPLLAIGLLRHFLEGPQDLSLTDTANEHSRRLWTGCGGAVAYAYSYSWTRPLQPLRAVLELAGHMDGSAAIKMATPVIGLTDCLLGRQRRFRPVRPECSVENIDSATLLELLKTVTSRSLLPQYDLPSLEWLIAMAEQSIDEGRLAKRCVRDAGGKILGWYIYYQNKNGLARVLQLAATAQSMEVVLNSLVYEAKQYGVAALWGRTEPQHAGLLDKHNCVFFARPWALVHSASPELIAAFQNADVFFSGLEGELWMKVNA